MPKKILSVIDLFAGTGSFSLAFKQTKKCKIVMANDYCKNSKKIYDANFDHKMIFEDLNKLDINDIPDHDILTGGFPCQPFSIAGQQKGFDDNRSNVFWKILKIIQAKSPRVVILENVKNLTSHDKGQTFKTIIENLEKKKYIIKHKVLNTSDYTNIPQNRERIYIVCFREKNDALKFNFNMPKIKKKPITSFLENQIDEKYYYTDKSKIYDALKKDITKNIKDGVIYQYRRYYVRENKSGNVPTLTANMGTGGHNVPILLDDVGIRKLTPRECFNLQGLPQSYKVPDDMSNCALYKLAGNAVSYTLVKKLANKIVELIY